MANRQAPVTTPGAFALARRHPNGSCEMVMGKHNAEMEHGQVSMPALAELFGSLLGPNDGPRAAYDDPRYLQSVNLWEPYKNRVVPFFGTLVNAQVLNNRASYLTTHICPIWETSEMNFTVNQKEFNSVPFTSISALGIPDEQTHFSYGWTDSMDKVALNARIERDLALDPNFGQEAWTDELAQFASNATLTLNINVIYVYLGMGWQNITSNGSLRQPEQNQQLRMLREAEGFLIFPRDAIRAFAMIRNFEDSIPDLDTVIGPSGMYQYIRDLQGESMTIPSTRPWTNPETNELMLDVYEHGVTPVMVMNLGPRRISFHELPPFMVNLEDQRKYQPLTQKVTLGQLHPPNPNVTPYDAVHTTDSNQQDVMLFYQTKSIGEERRITQRQRLEGALYWNKSGEVAQYVIDFVADLNAKADVDVVPWQWNEANTTDSRDYSNDINKDTADYNTPDMDEITGKHSLHEMRSWRSLPCGVGYDPKDGEYYIPLRMGDFPLGQIPHEYALKAVKHLVLKTQLRSGHADLDAVFFSFDKFKKQLKNAEWNTAYVNGLVNKNIVRMLNPDGTVTPTTTKDTNPTALKNFPGAHSVEEWRTNAYGTLDLPDKDGLLVTMDTPPGLLNAAGVRTLAAEADKSTSQWRTLGEKARFFVDVFNDMLNVSNAGLNATDATDTTLSFPWEQRPDALSALMNSYINPKGPIHLAVPAAVTRRVGAGNKEPVSGLTVVSRRNVSLLLSVLDSTDPLEDVNITDKERALAVVNLPGSGDSDDGGQMGLFADIIYGTDPSAARFANRLLFIAGYNDGVDEARSKNATLVASKALEPGAKLGDILDKIKDTPKQAYYNGLAKDYPAIQGSVKRAQKLFAYDKTVKVSQTTGFPTDEDVRENAQRYRGEVYEGDFSQAPTRFFRAPLTQSRQLLIYLNSQKNPYVLPSDPASFFEEPMTLEKAREEKTDAADAMDTESTTESSSTVKSALKDLSTYGPALRPLIAMLSTRGKGLAQSGRGSSSTVASRRVGSLFDSLHDDGDMGFSDMLRFGAPSKSDPRGRAGDRLAYDVGDSDAAKYLYKRAVHFRGPWQAHNEFAASVTSPAQRFFLRLLWQSRNHRSVPVALASVGAELFGVMMVRPFIQAKTDALILTVAGPRTALYAFGHSVVATSKENRGLYHMTCGFYHGIVRLNPRNVAMLPNALPREFIGGKKVDFMVDPTHFARANPNKESIIAFLIPASERTFASPMHLRNDETYLRPGDDGTIWERKCSAFGPFYSFVFRQARPERIDSIPRDHYGSFTPVAHVIHLGPTAYINGQTGRKEDIEGVGPSGERVMNMPGAQLVWEGQSHRFPQRAQYEFTTL